MGVSVEFESSDEEAFQRECEEAIVKNTSYMVQIRRKVHTWTSHASHRHQRAPSNQDEGAP